ncbi:hypothetical protein ASG89_03065 [Paenibacillus sp. Soil766]|uniref:hypothetical protein n=1 Tax=Paenibacillus sp. Soil766 TaxID=1736404 RepID=UPI00070D4D7D|nr:hypothetical protein [Paenibacillus sp. Soil766]KRF03755.1 hypothetical protein ASG89_03065 [Paenibacillus sp. Soil766]
MNKMVIDGNMSIDVKQLIDNLHLPDDDILDMFSFSFSGSLLTADEAVRFIHFLRSELDKRTQ